MTLILWELVTHNVSTHDCEWSQDSYNDVINATCTYTLRVKPTTDECLYNSRPTQKIFKLKVKLKAKCWRALKSSEGKTSNQITEKHLKSAKVVILLTSLKFLDEYKLKTQQ